MGLKHLHLCTEDGRKYINVSQDVIRMRVLSKSLGTPGFSTNFVINIYLENADLDFHALLLEEK